MDHQSVGENPNRRPSEPGRPLSIRAIVVGGVLVSLVGAAAVVALLYFYGGGTDQERAGLDVVRTAGTLVVGTGGAIALLLTARRQRSTELTLEHQRKVAAATERDAAEQRITELYTRAVDQLGAEKAPVRLGGLHALERLAQNTPEQRQTIVDVICAYLRMPYTPADDQPPTKDAPTEAHTRYEERRQELQVRMTAQRILGAHLRSDARDVFWTGIDLDLTEAHLHGLNLARCHVERARFGGAQFNGDTDFGRTRFSKDAMFSGVRFHRNVNFMGVEFGEDADFHKAQLGGNVHFMGAQFGGNADFGQAQFDADTEFTVARFGEDADFRGAQFGGVTDFTGAQFGGAAGFDRARARSSPRHWWPAGWTTRDGRTTEGEAEGWIYLVLVDDGGEQQPGSGRSER